MNGVDAASTHDSRCVAGAGANARRVAMRTGAQRRDRATDAVVRASIICTPQTQAPRLLTMTDMASILVVDDCQPVAGILARYLRIEGHNVSVAHDGASARAFVARSTPDCIFLDLMMPVMTGVELLHELRRDPATAAIPIVLVSARIGAGLTHVFSRCEANHSIGKPFTRGQVLEAVAAVFPHTASRVARGAGWRPAARTPLTYSI